ncbi:protein of unknown function [Trichlorobacter ammonificans]|uniref:Uncharacterized protein n=1 Tax=Trichlorobacter ammonificans TaxID=2916410 RepID=A0ABM9DBN9_9BACT|nr:protein of unknown function [Trichlorobacter ammonificans]
MSRFVLRTFVLHPIPFCYLSHVNSTIERVSASHAALPATRPTGGNIHGECQCQRP